MSATLLRMRHLDAPSAEDVMPQCTSLFTQVKSKPSVFAEPESVVVPTPMRLSASRSDYFTTNTRGEIVKIQSPLKQFKSTGRVLRKFAEIRDESKCPVKLGASLESASKSYKSIPSLKEPQGETSLETVLVTICDSFSDKEASNNPVVSYIVKNLATQNKKYTKYFYDQIPDAPEFQELKAVAKLTYFHAYTEDSWARVKEFIMAVIKVYKLDAILLDTPKEYRSAFGHSSDFIKADCMIAYTILSLVHFGLFTKRAHELHYWKKLSNQTQKTKYLINLLDKHVFRNLEHSECGVATAEKARLQFALPQCKELLSQLSLSQSRGFIIKLYTRGIEFTPFWVEALFERSTVTSSNVDVQIRHMKNILKNADLCAKMDPWYEEDQSTARVRYQLKFLTESTCYVNPEDFVVR